MKVENGSAVFDNIAFVGTPGSKKNMFFIKTTAINPTKISEILDLNQDSYENFIATLEVNFWECVAGEEFVDNQCMICESGWYALNVGDTCVPCVDNVECLGGNVMNITEGYWRDTLN